MKTHGYLQGTAPRCGEADDLPSPATDLMSPGDPPTAVGGYRVAGRVAQLPPSGGGPSKAGGHPGHSRSRAIHSTNG